MKRLYLLALILLASIGAFAQNVSLTSLGTSYNQDFNSLASTGSSSALPTGWLMSESGTGSANNGQYTAGTGSSNTGDTYSFGSAGSGDRAFGGLRSGSLVPLIGASFTNSTGATISSLTIQYHGEQWRLGTTNRGSSDRLDFQISYNATALSNGTWTDINELDFTGPVNMGTLGAIIGNNNAVTIMIELTGLNIQNGQTFFIRWVDVDISGSDDGLAIDNFSITPEGIVTPDPIISFSPGTLSFGEVNVSQNKTLSYEVTSSNLTDAISLSTNNPEYLISSDNINYGGTANLPVDGGIVYVKFTPTTNGQSPASITHGSGSYSKTLTVTGAGYEPIANIISIASARSKSVGTKVTVAGRVTVANELGNPAYVQDATGGIPVFESTLANNVVIGDSVIVTGPIGVFNDQKQISGSGIIYSKITAPSRIVEPKVISLSELAANEGILVTVENVQLLNTSFVFYPQSTEQLTDGTTTADLRIDGDTDIPGLAKPQGAFDVTGVVGRFRTNAQLLPRFHDDIPSAVEPTVVTDTIPKARTLDIVNWNFEFFGARSEDYGNEEYGPADEALQLQNIKSVLLNLNADIIAAEEISDERLFASLVQQMGTYDYVCSQRYSYSFEGPSSDFPPQKVCLIYNRETVDVLSARPMFEALYDEARTSNPSLLPAYPSGDPSSFYSSGRLPLLVNVKTRIEGVAENLSLIVVHAKSGSTLADWNRRVYDAKVLKDTLDASFAEKNFIILGDLNDDLDQSIVTGKPSSYLNFVSDANYLSVTKALSDAGARSTVSFQDVIDHQILSSNLSEAFLEGSQMIITPFRMIDNYGATTSDHLPVITRFILQPPVVGFDSLYSILTEKDTTLTIPLHFTKPFADNTTLTFRLTGSANYSDDYSTLPGGTSTTISLNVSEGDVGSSLSLIINDDILDEFSESVTITLVPALAYKIDNDQFSLIIHDNDVPTIRFESTAVDVQEGNTINLKLILSTPAVTDQIVTVDVSNGFKALYSRDYLTTPVISSDQITLNVPAGQESVSINVEAMLDKPRENDETITFALSYGTEGIVTLNSSTAVTIKNTRFRPIIHIAPNPTVDVIAVYSDEISPDEIVRVELWTAYGERILSASGTVEEINNQLALAMNNLRRGMLIFNLWYDDEFYSERVVKK